MDDQNRNLILATALSFLVILVWFLVVEPPQQAPNPDPTVPSEQELDAGDVAALPPTAGDRLPADPTATPEPAAEAVRIPIDTPSVSGSILLQGGRIDDLALKRYREEIDPDAPIVQLLNPVGASDPYYAIYGWTSADLPAEALPSFRTDWRIESGESLAPGSPVTLAWESPAGLAFRRTISVDEDYLFTVEQTVENRTDAPVRLSPYGIVARQGLPDDLRGFFIIHEGVIRMTDGTLEETNYSDLPDLVSESGVPTEAVEVAQNGWIGFTDHYWMTALIPTSGEPFTAATRYLPGPDIYQTEARLPSVTVAGGETATSTQQLFAGAKEWETIREYQQNGIDKFLDSIDWGWFFFLTKPIFAVLHWLNAQIGNMGVAIIVLTLVIKAVLFPLAYKSYVSMARMKELQPEMEKIKERAGDDRQKLQQEMMALYKNEKVNPASGCLPLLLQIPIFFSLYKVIFVTIELRHAPFVGWIRDLSAPDPSSIMNLFGLLPFAAPEPGSIVALIFIGLLPILLGISMWLQQKLNPAPTDPTQAMIFAYMPWVFMFMLGGFASGLVIYWIANNMITFTQQYIIMRSHGSKPDLFGNIRSSFKRKPAEKAPEKK
jgi:YidC/Oxa1 family membrane protein insertase